MPQKNMVSRKECSMSKTDGSAKSGKAVNQTARCVIERVNARNGLLLIVFYHNEFTSYNQAANKRERKYRNTVKGPFFDDSVSEVLIADMKAGIEHFGKGEKHVEENLFTDGRNGKVSTRVDAGCGPDHDVGRGVFTTCDVIFGNAPDYRYGRTYNSYSPKSGSGDLFRCRLFAVADLSQGP